MNNIFHEEEPEPATTTRKLATKIRGIYGLYEDTGGNRFWKPIAVDSSGRLMVVES